MSPSMLLPLVQRKIYFENHIPLPGDEKRSLGDRNSEVAERQKDKCQSTYKFVARDLLIRPLRKPGSVLSASQA